MFEPAFSFLAETYCSATCLFLSAFFVTIACKPRGLRVVACTLRSRLAAALSCGAGNLAVKKRWLRIARREPLQPAFPQLLPTFPALSLLFPQLFPAACAFPHWQEKQRNVPEKRDI